jgi:hypothetical protein
LFFLSRTPHETINYKYILIVNRKHTPPNRNVMNTNVCTVRGCAGFEFKPATSCVIGEYSAKSDVNVY